MSDIFYFKIFYTGLNIVSWLSWLICKVLQYKIFLYFVKKIISKLYISARTARTLNCNLNRLSIIKFLFQDKYKLFFHLLKLLFFHQISLTSLLQTYFYYLFYNHSLNTNQNIYYKEY